MRRFLPTSIALNLILLGFTVYLCVREPGRPTTATVESPRSSFHWSQIEASDYPTYIANLRAIGCPEETIRDIVTADVASLFQESTADFLRPSVADHRSPAIGGP